jgi:hypothetical protein
MLGICCNVSPCVAGLGDVDDGDDWLLDNGDIEDAACEGDIFEG